MAVIAAGPLELTSAATPQAALRAEERAAMHELLDTHFDGVTRAQFDRDLDGKDWVLRIFAGPRLVGFTTLAVSTTTAPNGERINVLYSGDTIMAPEAWGSSVLATGWIALVHRVRAKLPAGPCYWLLLSSGFRTYRFLPVFWREFFPRHDAPTPPAMEALRDRIARERFGPAYDPQAGVVRFAQPQRLRGALATVPEGRAAADPHVAFFLGRNPGWSVGDELVCLADLADDNLTAAGRRIVRAAHR